MFLEGRSPFFGTEGLAVDGLHYNANGQAVLAAELEVTLIVRGNGHDGAGAVFHQDEVPYPDGKLLLIKGIDGVAAGEKADLLGGSDIFRLHRSLAHLSELYFGVLLLGRAGMSLCTRGCVGARMMALAP